MAIVIGMDEAGYGPNYGPLLISASVWETAARMRNGCFYSHLQPAVCRATDADDREALVIADSKAVYQPGKGLAKLERCVLAALRCTGQLPADGIEWLDLWRSLDPDSADQLAALPWYREYRPQLPRDAKWSDAAAAAARLDTQLKSARMQLRSLSSHAAFPGPWNQLLDECGNKSTALTQLTLGLLKRLLFDLPDGDILVYCDKHGGRNQYGPQLQELFPDYLVEIYGESAIESIYRWGPKSRRIEVRFIARGEQRLPVALASMVSKYLRELAMEGFNQFWRQQQPDLKPTAGYPVDARRFRRDIEPTRQRLDIDNAILWRAK